MRTATRAAVALGVLLTVWSATQRSASAAPLLRQRPPQSTPSVPGVPLSLGWDMAWNGLGGFGPVASYDPVASVALDAALGYCQAGYKAGLRGRYRVVRRPVTGFVGLGLLGTSGTGGPVNSDDWRRVLPPLTPPGDSFTFEVPPGLQVQGVVGLEVQERHGVWLLVQAGWSLPVLGGQWRSVAGEPVNDVQRKAWDRRFGGGPLLGITVGYHFGPGTAGR